MIGWVLCIGGAYILGSIPFGYLLGRARGLDIRQHGSKNVGAANVGRVLGRRLGLICFLLDVSKGAVPVIVAGVLDNLITQPITSITPSQMWL